MTTIGSIYDAACPVCHAARRASCVDEQGKPLTFAGTDDVHAARIAAAARVEAEKRKAEKRKAPRRSRRCPSCDGEGWFTTNSGTVMCSTCRGKGSTR